MLDSIDGDGISDPTHVASRTPLLLDIESSGDGHHVATLECPKPPAALLDLLLVPPEMMVAEEDTVDTGTIISLRHPSTLLTTTNSHGYSFTSEEQLQYYLDVYELLSQRKLRQLVCLPALDSSTNTNGNGNSNSNYTYYEIQCTQPNCPFRLRYRREKVAPTGIHLRYLEVLPWETTYNNSVANTAASDTDGKNHTCQPLAEWNNQDQDQLELKKPTTTTTTGYAASDKLLNAIVVWYLLLQRRQGKLDTHDTNGSENNKLVVLEQLYPQVQRETGLQMSWYRYGRACQLYKAVASAFPTTQQEDNEICSNTFGLWCIGYMTKTLPNAIFLRLLAPTGAPTPPALRQDPLQPWWGKAFHKIRPIAIYGIKFLAFNVIICILSLFLFAALGPILLASAFLGVSWFHKTAEIYRNEGISIMEGYISEQFILSAGKGLLARYFWNRHYSSIVVTYIEEDGSVHHRGFLSTSLQAIINNNNNSNKDDHNDHDDDSGNAATITRQYQVIRIPMLKIPGAPAGSAFPRASLSHRYSLCKQAFHIAMGLALTLEASFVVSVYADGFDSNHFTRGHLAMFVVVGIQLIVLVAACKTIKPSYHFGQDPNLFHGLEGWKATVAHVAEALIYKTWQK